MEHWHDLINWFTEHQEPVKLITTYMNFIITSYDFSHVFFRKKTEKPTQLSQVDSSPSMPKMTSIVRLLNRH